MTFYSGDDFYDSSRDVWEDIESDIIYDCPKCGHTWHPRDDFEDCPECGADEEGNVINNDPVYDRDSDIMREV